MNDKRAKLAKLPANVNNKLCLSKKLIKIKSDLHSTKIYSSFSLVYKRFNLCFTQKLLLAKVKKIKNANIYEIYNKSKYRLFYFN